MKSARLVVAMLGVAAALATPATAGNAAVVPHLGVRPASISSCHGTLIDDSNIKELCDGSITYYRAWVRCTGSSSVFYGGYEQAGNGFASFAHCAVNHFVTAGGYNELGSSLLQQNI